MSSGVINPPNLSLSLFLRRGQMGPNLPPSLALTWAGESLSFPLRTRRKSTALSATMGVLSSLLACGVGWSWTDLRGRTMAQSMGSATSPVNLVMVCLCRLREWRETLVHPDLDPAAGRAAGPTAGLALPTEGGEGKRRDSGSSQQLSSRSWLAWCSMSQSVIT